MDQFNVLPSNRQRLLRRRRWKRIAMTALTVLANVAAIVGTAVALVRL